MEQKEKRPYNSPRRQEQARQTRQKILEAAQRLFASDGYVATTLPAIAREAGVSPATLTVVFGTKFSILDAIIKRSVRGDEASAPMGSRSWWQEMLSEPDPVRQLALFAAVARRIQEQSSDIAEIVRRAETADPELAALRRALGESRLLDTRMVIAALAETGALAPGMTVERATDILWTLSSQETYRTLVVERGWSPGDYEQWLASALPRLLLAHGP